MPQTQIPAAPIRSNTMTSSEILALSGPALDAAIHAHVFHREGKAARYSAFLGEAIPLLDRLPLFVARVSETHPRFDPARPFIAGTLAHEPVVKGDVTIVRVSAATAAVALTKAALLYTFREVKPAANPARTTSADAARAVAARIGTPGARNPNNPRLPQRRPRDPRPPMPVRPSTFVGPPKPPPAGNA